MASKMRAEVVEAFGKPLVTREWDIPTAGPGQIVVKTEACGVCHTDLHAASGDWPVKPSLPFIPGHEAIGIVSAVGNGVTIVKEGDRVGVPWLYSACGHCEYCLSAWETVCPDAQFGGYTKNGGFAEYILADPQYVAHIPEGLEATQAAPLICAGITTYKGIKETEAKPGEWLAISGCGGLGHLAIQYAKAMGLLVCAVDIDDKKLTLAKSLGADLTFNAKSGDATARLRKETGGGAHGVLITAPSLSAFKQGVGMARKRGTCVLVGLPPGEFPVPLFDVVANCITIRGSFVGTRQDMAETLAFAADGKVKADVELQPLESINTIFQRLEKGDVAARVVIDYMKKTVSEETHEKEYMRISFYLAGLGLLTAGSAFGQNSAWEGETGVFITPMAYTAPSTANGFGLPIVAYHYLYGGKVLGDFQEISVTDGLFQRFEFGYTRAFHNTGSVVSLSPLWHNGYNIFHAKFTLLPENADKRRWVPAIAVGFILRTQVHDVGAAILNKNVDNGDVYIVATKTITQTKLIPVILSGGIRGTNAELWGMGGSTPNAVERAFGAIGFVFKGPAHTSFILASEVSQQPRHPSQLPTAVIPTTFTYAIRFVPTPEHRINFDFGVAQIAGQIAPGVNLQARAQVAAQVSYGF